MRPFISLCLLLLIAAPLCTQPVNAQSLPSLLPPPAPPLTLQPLPLTLPSPTFIRIDADTLASAARRYRIAPYKTALRKKVG
ncbi:MAG: hypothetical protein IAF08_08575, partial [Rhizobacter sp.]|nr:hypothetical protein [Chlorobiales bacterium]